jgi:MoaA/NifB/PqqE/SkfB family radical SAM enzyme
LADYARELAGLADTVTISLDSHDGVRHDRLRGLIGAWKATVDGIHRAVEYFGAEGVTVNSVLFPKKLAYLAGMPKLLRRLGVTNWVVSPLIDFRKDNYTSDLSQLHQDLLYLSDLAKAEGVELYLADEFRRYESTDLYQSLSVAAVESDNYVVRLSPNGTLSRGREILRESSHAPIWDRVEEPSKFLTRVLAGVGRKFD